MNAPGPVFAPRDLAGRLPLAPGVYRFRDAAGQALYLGRAVSLRRRVLSYWSDLGGRAHLAPMVARVARVEAVVCDSAHEAAWLERNLLQARLPPWNRSRNGGQEVEVWIRLSESARRPSVDVVHQRSPVFGGARHFGPYLGGRQVRLAVSGLCRMLPLQYAGGELAGTRGELARVLGVSGTERAALAQTVAAVLDRDPSAVAALRTGLCARRDAAAGALAFEFAARLRDEIEALDLGHRRAEGHQARGSRRRRVRLGGRHAGPLRGARRAADRVGPARLRRRVRPRPSQPDTPGVDRIRPAQCRARRPARRAGDVIPSRLGLVDDVADRRL